MTLRKEKVFSISMSKKDMQEIDEHVEKLERESGYLLSRNELIRRATLAHIRFSKKSDSKTYEETFKQTVGK